MPAPPIRLPPSRPPPCPLSSPPTVVRGIQQAQGAGSARLKRHRSRRRREFRRPPLPLRRKRDFRRRQRPRRSAAQRRSLRPHHPHHRRPLVCSSRRHSRCGGQTLATDRAARPATGPAARSSPTTPRRRPCVWLPTKSRRSPFSGDNAGVVQDRAWKFAWSYPAAAASSSWLLVF